MNYVIESVRFTENNFHIQVSWTYDGSTEFVYFGREGHEFFIKDASEDVLLSQVVGAERYAKLFLSQKEKLMGGMYE